MFVKGRPGYREHLRQSGKGYFIFAIIAKHNHATVTVSGDIALSLGRLVHHVCSQHGICHCIFSAHLLKYSDCNYID